MYIFLSFISLAAILCGIFIIFTRNPMVFGLFLIDQGLNVATHMMMVGIYFVSLSDLLVYVGAVSILFYFFFVY